MCCRESTMALNGWLEWTTTHPKNTASPGDTPTIPGTSGQWPLLSRDLLRRIRGVTTIFFSPIATRSAPPTPTSRFSYGRPDANLFAIWPGSSPLARTLPQIQIANVSALGLAAGDAQFHHGENFLFQETQTKLSGRHNLRYGVEFLQQRVTQQRGANDVGAFSFMASPGYSAFANFLDDFSGPSGSATRVFGAPVFHPDQLHQTYFFQDNWKVTPTLAVTLGIRYENFGQFAN